MKTLLWTAIAVLVPVMLLAQSSTGVANGNGTDQGTVLVPDTSKENSADTGRKAHTNHLILMRASARQSYLSGLTPADIGRAYNVSPSGAGVIAIVDAYHYPTASADLAHFASGQGVTGFAAIAPLNACPTGGPTGTTACFWQVWVDPATGGLTTDTKKMPPTNCGWNQEAALDIQWAHAMAPNASIVLVEAQSNSFSDLFAAVRVATGLTGARQVSMSWGGSEFSTEAYYDQYFPPGNVVYIASSGDTGGKTIYPSVSPYVLAAGGTTLNMSGSRGSATLKSETGWSGSGGGTSTYEPAAPFQDVIRTKVGNARGVPDLSFDADPNTGVLVYGPSCSGTNASNG